MSDFHLLLEEQIPSLIRYASALTRDREQAAELVEDTVTEILHRSGVQRRGGDFRVRLLTVLHELRGNPFRQADPAANANDPPVDPAVLLTLSDLDRAIGQLSEERRAVILLIGLEGLSYKQTAAILGIPEGTMRSRLTRGRDSLRRALGVAEESHQQAA